MSQRTKFLIFFAIVLLNLIVFFPSFSHISRNDNDVFLAEIADKNTLSELVSYNISYTRTRIFGPGDQILFRPALYVFLSLEKWLFGYQFVYWQLTGFLFHLLVLWQLWRILELIRPSIFVPLFVLVFSVLSLAQEMVIWQHVNAYLLALFLIIKSLEHFTRFFISNKSEVFRLYRIIIYLTIASFIHELTIVCNVILIAVFLFKTKDIRKSIWLAIPIFIYLLWSSLDYFYHVGLIKPTETTLPNIGQAAYHFFRVFFLSWILPFVASFVPTVCRSRLIAESLSIKDWFHEYSFGSICSNLNLVLIVFSMIFIGSCLYFLTRKQFQKAEHQSNAEKEKLLAGWISLGFSLGFIALFILGRLSQRAAGYLEGNLYNFYTIILFNVIFIYAVGSSLAQRILPQQKALMAKVLAGILILLAFLNGYQNYKNNVHMKIRCDEFVKRQALDFEGNYLLRHYAALGLIYLESGQYQNALDEFFKADQISPNNPEVYNLRGLVYLAQENYPQALDEFDKALKGEKIFANYYSNRGLVLRAMKKYDEALIDFNQAIEINDSFAEGYDNRGLVYADMQKHDLAIQQYIKAISLNQNDSKFYNNRAVSYRALGINDLALKDYDQAILLKPRYESFYNRGNIYFQLGKIDLALKDYNESVKLNSGFTAAYINRGAVYLQQNNFSQALVDFNRAIELGKSGADVFYQRSYVYWSLKDFKNALSDALRSKELGNTKIDDYIFEIKNKMGAKL